MTISQCLYYSLVLSLSIVKTNDHRKIFRMMKSGLLNKGYPFPWSSSCNLEKGGNGAIASCLESCCNMFQLRGVPCFLLASLMKCRPRFSQPVEFKMTLINNDVGHKTLTKKRIFFVHWYAVGYGFTQSNIYVPPPCLFVVHPLFMAESFVLHPWFVLTLRSRFVSQFILSSFSEFD